MWVWGQRKLKNHSEQKCKRKKKILNLTRSQSHIFFMWPDLFVCRELHLIWWVHTAVAICRCTDCIYFLSLCQCIFKNKIKISTQNKNASFPHFPSPNPQPLPILRLSTLNSLLPQAICQRSGFSRTSKPFAALGRNSKHCSFDKV